MQSKEIAFFKIARGCPGRKEERNNKRMDWARKD